MLLKLRKEKNRKRTGNCDFQLENMLVTFLSKKKREQKKKKQKTKTDSTSLKMHLFQGLHS